MRQRESMRSFFHQPLTPLSRALRWWRAPFWAFALLTGAKSFVDNPILGSRRLNRAGLHLFRIRAAHALGRWRRRQIGRNLPEDLRKRFDADGFLVIHDVLPAAELEALRSAFLNPDHPCRAQQQGDTITSRIALGPELLKQVPALARLLGSAWWGNLLAYVASTRSKPLYYIQAIAGGVIEGPPDPQLELHADTFHPSMKAWLFLTDVEEADRPLTYVAGSHRLTAERASWERRKSIEVLDGGDRLSQRGSVRIKPEELAALGLPPPTRFCVPANTLVVADTCGFHARAASHRRSLRVELWGYCRRSPFLPWTGGDLLSLPLVADRRAKWLISALDWLDRRGWMKQHWKPAPPWRAEQG